MREKLIRFMAGRNGNDQFNMFLLVVELVLIVVSTVLSGSIGRFISPVIILLICYTYFRMLSRNLNRRRDENTRYLRLKYRVEASLRVGRERWVQRKDYKFFVCPSCKTTLRVPRGHGRIKIVCRKCGTSFTGKT